MFRENKRLHTSYLSDGVLSSFSSSSQQTINTLQHYDSAKPQLYENRGGSSGIADFNTLTERKNGVNRMIDLVDSSLNPPIGNEAKTLSSDPSLTETRRRSHRPRGCRGGRKNRKSQQAKAQALLPKEILDDDASSQHHSVSKRSQDNVQTWEKPANVNSISYAGGLPFMGQSYGGTTAFSTSALSCILKASEQTSSPPPPPPCGNLPVHTIQESKTASGNSFSMRMASGANLNTQKVPFYAPSHNNGMRVDPYKPMPCGTLTLNAAAAHNSNALSKLPPRAPLIFSPPKSGCNSASTIDYYQTLLIQNHRPMMPSGGSLFATSPRSFLFGRPSEPPSIAW